MRTRSVRFKVKINGEESSYANLLELLNHGAYPSSMRVEELETRRYMYFSKTHDGTHYSISTGVETGFALGPSGASYGAPVEGTLAAIHDYFGRGSSARRSSSSHSRRSSSSHRRRSSVQQGGKHRRRTYRKRRA